MPVISPTPQGSDHVRPDSQTVIEPSTTATDHFATQGKGSGRDSSNDSTGRGWRRWIIGGGILAAAGAGVVLWLTTTDSSEPTTAPVTIRAVEAEQRDLIEFTDLDGTMTYATTRSVSAAADGTIIAVANDGDTLIRGDVVYEIDGTPIIVLYGDTPLYRPLAEGDEGDDVAVLEANLASLGYHTELDEDDNEIDRGFTVDGVFDAATTDAVEAWQADLGVDETGTVDAGEVIVIAGPAVVSDIEVDVASAVRAGSPILELNMTASVDAVYSAHDGELELQTDSGPVASGQVLYTVDDLPITAIVTDEPMDRDLFDGVTDGDDVTVVEQMLADLGYDAGGDLVVDDEFDEFTTEAIEDWQEDLQDDWDDVIVDGVFSIADTIVVETGTIIGSVTARDGDLTATGSELFTTTAAEGNRIVQTSIDVADQDKLSEGATVDVEFPDGSIVAGTVTEVATSSTKDPTNPNAEATLAVEITLTSIPDSAVGLNELDVEVKLVDELAEGATVVPASALVTTADGGYAVEVVTGATTTDYVAVEPGMFADGFVEVTGIAPGTAVVVPS